MSDVPSFYCIQLSDSLVPSISLKANGIALFCRWFSYSRSTKSVETSGLHSNHLRKVIDEMVPFLDEFVEEGFTMYVVEINGSSLPSLLLSVTDIDAGRVQNRSLVKRVQITNQRYPSCIENELERLRTHDYHYLRELEFGPGLIHPLFHTRPDALSKLKNLTHLSFDLLDGDLLGTISSLVNLKSLEVRTFKRPTKAIDGYKCKDLSLSILKCTSIHLVDLLHYFDVTKIEKVHVLDPEPNKYWCKPSDYTKEELVDLLNQVPIVRTTKKFADEHHYHFRPDELVIDPTTKGYIATGLHKKVIYSPESGQEMAPYTGTGATHFYLDGKENFKHTYILRADKEYSVRSLGTVSGYFKLRKIKCRFTAGSPNINATGVFYLVMDIKQRDPVDDLQEVD
uniref:Uncharacterized protein n=1 Tax=viral metagenome TaxID=1070528 RepID=A0A6C0JY27_9ZZZZ